MRSHYLGLLSIFGAILILLKDLEAVTYLGKEGSNEIHSALDKNIFTDKFISGHVYDVMYGMFLLPYFKALKSDNTKMRLFEIGLGCNMGYGPSKSVLLWKKLFGDFLELYEADHDKKCVDAEKLRGSLEGVTVVTGSSGNRTDVESWVTATGGNFHVIIDDAGHTNYDIKTAFDVLFDNALAPGGLYFLEDLFIGRHSQQNHSFPVISDIVQSWVEQLIIPAPTIERHKINHVMRYRKLYPVPKSVKWVFCQFEACVIGKCETPNCRPKAKYWE